jgi:uncharacterized membrane protein YidH (DUF202 family)
MLPILPRWIHIVFEILILTGILLLAYTTLVEILHQNDKGWTKPKRINTLEWIAIGCFVVVFVIVIIIAVILTILHK